ncbi:hemin-degrading family protein [Moraxella macacae 0408225]|uniref:Hemin-degrading family protein n=1 Tax=Moraxella macacae 0408225 TaxID=1230338 RepID=L2F9U5_9GAMM|nr:hemin-degrading factor [Moraxella macacae]ELA09660.1 hemin-degrading family protein [Moraxella macacae 0408225]
MQTTAKIVLNTVQKNSQLWQTYQAKKAETPMLFPTEGAMVLGVSELELLLASPNSRYLGDNCRDMLLELHTLGVVESIVRNEFCVHEQQGVYRNLELGKMMGLALGDGSDGLDLRLFLHKFKHMLAIVNNDKAKPSYSIAFFDERGNAINKAFLTQFDDDSVQTWQQLTDKFAENAASEIELLPIAPQNQWQLHTLNVDDKQQFGDDWQAMTDIHQFHSILKKYELDRASGYHNAPDGMAVAVKPEIVEVLLNKLASEQVNTMIFVGNMGMVQIFAGGLHHIKRMGNWLNVMDKKATGFTLHLNDKALTQVWFIKRPNSDGFTSAFEGFDAKGNSIVTWFGVRTEGQQQDPKWQELAQNLADEFKLEQ